MYDDVFHLTSGDFDHHLRIKPCSIFNLFQEAALVHANILHVGNDALKEKNKAWILLRSKYVLFQQPKESQKVKVQTWPLPGQKVEYNREFRILDMEENILVKGTSKWCIIDLDTKKISRQGLTFNGEFYTETNFDESFDKLPNIEVGDESLVYTHQVRISDLDHYQHMNNAKYSEIILNALELKEDEYIKEVQINFINEMKLNEVVKILKTKVKKGYYVIGCKNPNIIAFRAYVKISNL